MMHSIQIHKVIQLMISFFCLIGVWHRGDKPTVKEFRIKLFYTFYYPLLALSLAVGAIKNDKEDQSIFLAEVAIEVAVLTTKLWLLIWKQNEILYLLSRVCVISIRSDDDWNLLNAKLRGFMNFVLVFLILSVAGSSGSLILSFRGSEKTFFLKIAFPMDYQNNEIAFWFATIFLSTEMALTVVVDIFTTIIWYLLLMCSLRYQVLGNELKNLGIIKKNAEGKMTKKHMQNKYFGDLKASIDDHLHIRGLASELESFFSDLFFVQFGTSGLCICGSIYFLAFDVGENLPERIVHFLAFIYFIYGLFMITYFGNEIMLSSNRLSYSLFESDWYNQPQSTKKCIVIFGEYLKRPQEIVIGKLYPLTLETFTRILNSGYSMFNILKRFQQ
ncbi:odorant receptor 94a-like [Bradysia coprophila]|uniref:odorant receptor 94a-like n=1 Tax=Bradysia coprophila TaxID=38358 RepID=UPI00187D8072|nr:odorant receptor 94a-like [Bradysia coprophila]